MEIVAFLLKRCQFDRQHVVVPTRTCCQAIVGNDVRALLRLGEVIEDDDRDFGKGQLASRQQATVAGNDSGVGVYKQRIGEAEFPNTGRNLSDLSIRVCPAFRAYGMRR